MATKKKAKRADVVLTGVRTQAQAQAIADRLMRNTVVGAIAPDMTHKHSHYYKQVAHLDFVDVYRVLKLFSVTDPCIQHAIKKLLVAGGRGAGKDIKQDIQETIDSLVRWQQMEVEDGRQVF